MSCHLTGANYLSRGAGNPGEFVGLTFASWFRWTIATPVWEILYSLDDGITLGVQLGANNDGTQGYGIFYAGNYLNLIAAPGTSWHFTALTCKSNNAVPGAGTAVCKAYVGDGSSALTTVTMNTAFNQGTGPNLYLGQDGYSDGGGGDYVGFRLWDRVLSAAEIDNEYRRIMPCSFNGLNTWLPLLNASSPGANRVGTAGSLTVTGTPTASGSCPPAAFGGRHRLGR